MKTTETLKHCWKLGTFLRLSASINVVISPLIIFPFTIIPNINIMHAAKNSSGLKTNETKSSDASIGKVNGNHLIMRSPQK